MRERLGSALGAVADLMGQQPGPMEASLASETVCAVFDGRHDSQTRSIQDLGGDSWTLPGIPDWEAGMLPVMKPDWQDNAFLDDGHAVHRVEQGYAVRIPPGIQPWLRSNMSTCSLILGRGPYGTLSAHCSFSEARQVDAALKLMRDHRCGDIRVVASVDPPLADPPPSHARLTKIEDWTDRGISPERITPFRWQFAYQQSAGLAQVTTTPAGIVLDRLDQDHRRQTIRLTASSFTAWPTSAGPDLPPRLGTFPPPGPLGVLRDTSKRFDRLIGAWSGAPRRDRNTEYAEGSQILLNYWREVAGIERRALAGGAPEHAEVRAARREIAPHLHQALRLVAYACPSEQGSSPWHLNDWNGSLKSILAATGATAAELPASPKTPHLPLRGPVQR